MRKSRWFKARCIRTATDEGTVLRNRARRFSGSILLLEDEADAVEEEREREGETEVGAGEEEVLSIFLFLSLLADDDD